MTPKMCIVPRPSLPQQSSHNFCIFRVAKNYRTPFRRDLALLAPGGICLLPPLCRQQCGCCGYIRTAWFSFIRSSWLEWTSCTDLCYVIDTLFKKRLKTALFDRAYRYDDAWTFHRAASYKCQLTEITSNERAFLQHHAARLFAFPELQQPRDQRRRPKFHTTVPSGAPRTDCGHFQGEQRRKHIDRSTRALAS